MADLLSPSVGRIRGLTKLRSWLRLLALPQALTEIYEGHENFEFPGTWQLLDLPSERPDILH